MSENDIKEFHRKYGKYPIRKDFAVINMLAQEANRELDLLKKQLESGKLLIPLLSDNQIIKKKIIKIGVVHLSAYYPIFFLIYNLERYQEMFFACCNMGK